MTKNAERFADWFAAKAECPRKAKCLARTARGATRNILAPWVIRHRSRAVRASQRRSRGYAAGMDEATILRHLEQARKHVAEGERHIAQQRAIVAKLECPKRAICSGNCRSPSNNIFLT